MKTLTTTLFSLLILATACGADSDNDSEISKTEAATLDGKSDRFGDICERFGWYGDGECDTFCQEPDVKDCSVSCSDNSEPVRYCAPPEPCTDGLVQALNQGCQVCVDPNTCQPPVVSCDDDSTPVQYCAPPEPCADGLIHALNQGCRVCVDPNTCQPPSVSCDDDSTPVQYCAPPEPCADGLIHALNQGCRVCVDPNTCQPPVESCDDGSEPVQYCAPPEPCEDGLVQALNQGCQVCVDPVTCQPPVVAETCGGIAGLTCADDQVCIHEAGTCNVADGTGTCVTAGDFCPAVVDPVCGCNGRTYNNACEATRAGASVDYDGACENE